MPYNTISDLPDNVRSVLPEKAQRQWLAVFNATVADDGEQSARQQAWGAVKENWKPGQDGKWVGKLSSSLYLSRPVANADQIIAWAKAAGFPTTMEAGALHTTLIYSKQPVEWDAVGIVPKPHASHGGKREVVRLGDGGAVVLKFEDEVLTSRWKAIIGAGAKSDYSSFTPHVTISWNVPDSFDLSSIEPYRDPIIFGPEVLMPIEPEFKPDLIIEKARVLKVDDFGIVWGWAIICTVDDEPYFDLNIDREGPLAGQRVPENIPDDVMMRACVNFAKTARPGNDMHAGPDRGTFDFLFPMTKEMADRFGFKTSTTGLIVGYRPPADLLAKFKSGERKGFSIEGWRDDGRIID